MLFIYTGWIPLNNSLRWQSVINWKECGRNRTSSSSCCLSYDRSVYPLPNRVLPRVRSSASSFNFQHPVFSLRSSSSSLRLLPRLLFPSIFPSVTCFITQDVTNPASRPILVHFLFYLLIYRASMCMETIGLATIRKRTFPNPEQ
jgi:hypothetical protein